MLRDFSACRTRYKDYQFDQRADFSTILNKNKIIASHVGPSGEACLLAVAPEYEKNAFRQNEQKAFATFPHSKAETHYPVTFLRLKDGELLQRSNLSEVELAFPSVQPLPNDEILVVGPRCHYRNGDPEKNAVVFDADGKILRRFVLGDGIQNVQTTTDGLIWVSYFDEGVFGNYGWERPMGAPGLICFGPGGEILWEFAPPPGFDSICDSTL